MDEGCPKGIKSCDECPRVWKCIEECDSEEEYVDNYIPEND